MSERWFVCETCGTGMDSEVLLIQLQGLAQMLRDGGRRPGTCPECGDCYESEARLQAEIHRTQAACS